MDKEREVFDEWYGIKPKGRFEAIRYNTAWRAWQAAKAQKVAVPAGFVLVPKTNSDKGIESMAMRYRHDFPLLDVDYQEAIKSQMRQLYEEAVGLGFYRHKAQESGND